MTARASVWALVPVKSFARAKSRLSGVLGDTERAAFARGLCEHVLDVLGTCSALGGVLVVTDGAEVALLARERGVEVMEDPSAAPLGAIVDAGMAGLAARGADGALVIMSDLPRLATADVEELLRALQHADVVLAPDLAELGTNALALAPPDRFASCFGHADSCARHRARAQGAGRGVTLVRRPGLAFDVDGPEDYARLS